MMTTEVITTEVVKRKKLDCPIERSKTAVVLGDHGQPVAFACGQSDTEKFFRLYDHAKKLFTEVGFRKIGSAIWLTSKYALQHQQTILIREL